MNHNYWPPFPRDAAGRPITDLSSPSGQRMIGQQARALVTILRARGAKVFFISPVPAGAGTDPDPGDWNPIWHGYLTVLHAMHVAIAETAGPLENDARAARGDEDDVPRHAAARTAGRRPAPHALRRRARRHRARGVRGHVRARRPARQRRARRRRTPRWSRPPTAAGTGSWAATAPSTTSATRHPSPARGVRSRDTAGSRPRSRRRPGQGSGSSPSTGRSRTSETRRGSRSRHVHGVGSSPRPRCPERTASGRRADRGSSPLPATPRISAASPPAT